MLPSNTHNLNGGRLASTSKRTTRKEVANYNSGHTSIERATHMHTHTHLTGQASVDGAYSSTNHCFRAVSAQRHKTSNMQHSHTGVATITIGNTPRELSR